jgi:hypothetical protein
MSNTPTEIEIQKTDARVSGDESDKASINRKDDKTNSSATTKLSALNRILRRTLVALAVVWASGAVVCLALGEVKSAINISLFSIMSIAVAITIHTSSVQSLMVQSFMDGAMTPNDRGRRRAPTEKAERE